MEELSEDLVDDQGEMLQLTIGLYECTNYETP